MQRTEINREEGPVWLTPLQRRINSQKEKKYRFIDNEEFF
jgi:hypothetical protein